MPADHAAATDREVGASSRTGRTLRAWAAVVLWALVVWALGTDSFSAAETSRFIRPIVEWFGLELSGQEMFRLLVWIRRLAHLLVYGTFALLSLRALWLGTRLSLASDLALTVALVVLLAAADEWRQAASSVRGGHPGDVVLDLTGGVAALALAGLANLWVGRGARRPPPAG